MKLNSLNSSNVFHVLGEEIERELAAISNKYGLKITYGGGTLGTDQATMKLRLSVISPDGEAPEAVDFRRYASIYGLKPDDLGRQFIYGGRVYTIAGLRMAARTTPILANQVSTGKTYRFHASTVRDSLGKVTVIEQSKPEPTADEMLSAL